MVLLVIYIWSAETSSSRKVIWYNSSILWFKHDLFLFIGDTPLHVVARMGTVKMAALLLEYIGVESTISDGKTALHEASSASNMVVRLLIEKGSSINFLKMADW